MDHASQPAPDAEHPLNPFSEPGEHFQTGGYTAFFSMVVSSLACIPGYRRRKKIFSLTSRRSKINFNYEHPRCPHEISIESP